MRRQFVGLRECNDDRSVGRKHRMQWFYAKTDPSLGSIWNKRPTSCLYHFTAGRKTGSGDSSTNQHDELGPQDGRFVDRFPIFLDRLLPLRRVVIGEETGSTKAGDSQLSLINQGLRFFDP